MVKAKIADTNAFPRLNLAPTQDALVARMVSEEIRLEGSSPLGPKTAPSPTNCQTLGLKPSTKNEVSSNRSKNGAACYRSTAITNGKTVQSSNNRYTTPCSPVTCFVSPDFGRAGPNQSKQPPLLPGLELGQAEPTSLHTFTLITTTPNRLAKRVHE